MKIGFVLECSLSGPDAIIYPDVFKKLCEKVDLLKPKTLVNKRELLSEGHIWVQEFVNQGCDYVFMIWDRKPGWGGKANCEEDKQTIIANLNIVDVPITKVRLCCIDEMLESWLIADSRGFNSWVTTITTRSLREFPDHKTEPEQTDPENRIRTYFRNNFPKWKFNKFIDCVKIYQQLPEFLRARRWNESFNEYCNFIEELCP